MPNSRARSAIEAMRPSLLAISCWTRLILFSFSVTWTGKRMVRLWVAMALVMP